MFKKIGCKFSAFYLNRCMADDYGDVIYIYLT